MGKDIQAKRAIVVCAAAIVLALTAFSAFLPSRAHAAELVRGDVQSTLYAAASFMPGSGNLFMGSAIPKKYSTMKYQCQIAADSKFKKGVVNKFTKNKTVVFGKLKKGKKYYARIRLSVKSSNGTMVSAWSNVKSFKAAIPWAKAKLVGTWKLVKSNKASENNAIKYNKKYFPNATHTLTFMKNGVCQEKSYAGKKSSFKWVADAPKNGYSVVTVKGVKVKAGSVKVNGKKLTMNDGDGRVWKLVRI